MPTVLREGRYRFYWFSHELGEPPHVHEDRDDCTAKFWLEPVCLGRNLGFPAAELRHLRKVIEKNQHSLLEAWHGHFGN